MENVVSPPSRPVTRNRRHSGARPGREAIQARAGPTGQPPARLAASVPSATGCRLLVSQTASPQRQPGAHGAPRTDRHQSTQQLHQPRSGQGLAGVTGSGSGSRPRLRRTTAGCPTRCRCPPTFASRRAVYRELLGIRIFQPEEHVVHDRRERCLAGRRGSWTIVHVGTTTGIGCE